jgi:hypothetical protein
VQHALHADTLLPEGAMSEEFEQIRARLENEESMVKTIRVASSPEFGLDLDPAAIGQLVIAVSLVSFVEAVAGKFAEDGWDLLKKAIKAVIRRLKPPDSSKAEPISVVYRSELKGTPLEVVLHYRDYTTLARDVRNHQQYLALALGFASAQAVPVAAGVSLLPLLPAKGRDKPSGFLLRPPRSR